MSDEKYKTYQDPRLVRLLERLEEMSGLVEQLPEPERKIGREALARIRKELQPLIDSLTTRH